MKRTKIIAEAGVNHDGSFEKALMLCDLAKKAGADVVKFQTFKTENILTQKAQLADYQKDGELVSQFELIKKLEVSFSDFVKIKQHCDKIGIEFLSTPDDEESLHFLVNDLGLKLIKVGSGEIDNLPYLRQIAAMKTELIVSTGTATLEEVIAAKDALIAAGADQSRITFLQCTSAYPARFEDMNLKAMTAISNATKCSVGLSDHSIGYSAPLAAVAMGATVIEKHFTYDRNAQGPDHKASLSAEELATMIRSIREVEQSLGSGIKEPSAEELENKKVIRKVIVAKKPVAAGEKFTVENLTTKRAGKGITPMMWDILLKKTASKDYSLDEEILSTEI